MHFYWNFLGNLQLCWKIVGNLQFCWNRKSAVLLENCWKSAVLSGNCRKSAILLKNCRKSAILLGNCRISAILLGNCSSLAVLIENYETVLLLSLKGWEYQEREIYWHHVYIPLVLCQQGLNPQTPAFRTDKLPHWDVNTFVLNTSVFIGLIKFQRCSTHCGKLFPPCYLSWNRSGGHVFARK